MSGHFHGTPSHTDSPLGRALFRQSSPGEAAQQIEHLEHTVAQLERRLEIAEAQAAQFRRLRDALGLEWVVEPERLAARLAETHPEYREETFPAGPVNPEPAAASLLHRLRCWVRLHPAH